MNFKLNPKSAVLGAVLVLSGALAADELPGLIQYVFKAGDPIRSAEVNANFASLNTAVNVLQGGLSKPVTTDRLAEGSVTAGKLQSRTAPSDGQVLSYQDGQLTWSAAAQGPKGDPGPQGPAGAQGRGGLKFYSVQEYPVRVVPGNNTFVQRCQGQRELPMSGGFLAVNTQGRIPDFLIYQSGINPNSNRAYVLFLYNKGQETYDYKISLVCIEFD